METFVTASSLFIDVMIIILLAVAIVMGAFLLWQIRTLRRERFQFDQMTKALGGQLSIFQSALANGKDDVDARITRLNTVIERAQNLIDELHLVMAEADVYKSAPPKRISTMPNAALTSQAAVRKKSPLEGLAKEAPLAPDDRPVFAIIDPEYMANVKEDKQPAMNDFDDLSDLDRRELSQLATPAEKALMAALKRAGKRS